jgi:hypothetical protein
MKKLALACLGTIFSGLAADSFAQDLTLWYGRQSRHSSWGVGLTVPGNTYYYNGYSSYYPPPVYAQTTCYPAGTVVTQTPTVTYVQPVYQCRTNYYPAYYSNTYYYGYWWP